MKKYIILLLSILSVLPLAGCGASFGSGVKDGWSTIVLNSPTAKMETADGQTVYVTSDISNLRTFADLSLSAAPMEPAGSPDDWAYRITFNPSDKVTGAEELVVSFHDTYVQIGNEYFLPEQDVPYESIMEWASGKFDYFLR